MRSIIDISRQKSWVHRRAFFVEEPRIFRIALGVMLFRILCFFLIFSFPCWTLAVTLSVEDYDEIRQRVSLMNLDSERIPLESTFQIHGKTETCKITIIEQVNQRLIGETLNCDNGTITQGTELAYSQTNQWEQSQYPQKEGPIADSSSRITIQDENSDLLDEILSRTSFFIGHNLSNRLEGHIYNDGSLRNIHANTAFSFGARGRLYTFQNDIHIAMEIGYESSRSLNPTPFKDANGAFSETNIFAPRFSVFNLAALGEFQVSENLSSFAGINYNFPIVSQSPFDLNGDFGFQGGIGYRILSPIWVEGLIKVNNMNLENNMGETTNVSLAGFEFRGRYSF